MAIEEIVGGFLEYLISGNVKAYPDTAPRGANYPVLTYSEIKTNKTNRDLSGKASNSISSWRVVIIAKTRHERKLISEQLEKMDGLKNNHFMLVTVEDSGNGPVNNLQDFYTRSIDFKIHQR